MIHIMFLTLILFMAPIQAMDNQDEKKRPREELLGIEVKIEESGDALKRSKGDDDQQKASACEPVQQKDVHDLDIRLEAAIKKDNKELCEQLIEQGASPLLCALSAFKHNKLGLCRLMFSKAPLKALLAAERLKNTQPQHQALVDSFIVLICTQFGSQLLAMAVRENNTQLWAYLIKIGARPKGDGNFFLDLLRQVFTHENEPLLELILQDLPQQFIENQLFPAALRANALNVCSMLIMRKLVNPKIVIRDAVHANNVPMCELLLENGADADGALLNSALGIFNSEIHGYSSYIDWENHVLSKEELFELLVQHGAHSPEALKYAVAKNKKPLCERLLKNGADPTVGLIQAKRSSNNGLCKFFVLRGAHYPDALKDAVDGNNKSLCEQLLKNGADPAVGLQYALHTRYKGKATLIDFFLEKGAPAPSVEDLNKALKSAVERNFRFLCDQLLEKGASPEVGLEVAAAKYSHFGATTTAKLHYFAKLFLERGVKNDFAIGLAKKYKNLALSELCSQESDATPEDLKLAVRANNRARCEKILQHTKIDPNIGLVQAAKKYNRPLCELFLKAGASLAALKKEDVSTLLVRACKKKVEHGQEDPEEFALYLLGLGLELDLTKEFTTKMTALRAAAEEGKSRAVQALLIRGAQLSNRREMLQAAAAKGYEKIVHKLLLYAPLMHDKAVVGQAYARSRTFLCCLKRLQLASLIPNDLLRLFLPDDMKIIMADRLRFGKPLSPNLLAYAKGTLWNPVSEEIVADMDAIRIKEKGEVFDQLRRLLLDPGKLAVSLKDDIQELCEPKVLLLN